MGLIGIGIIFCLCMDPFDFSTSGPASGPGPAPARPLPPLPTDILSTTGQHPPELTMPVLPSFNFHFDPFYY
jgi:hypothetical protein